jgi:hypothetical protein
LAKPRLQTPEDDQRQRQRERHEQRDAKLIDQPVGIFDLYDW